MAAQRTTLPNTPAKRAADFDLGDGLFARVVYLPQENKPDRITVECQAFQVDANGNFVPSPSGSPSRTPGTLHTISVTGIGDTHTLQPGWVRLSGYAIEPDPAAKQKALPEGTLILDERPATAEVGAYVFVGEELYRWDEGMLNAVMRGKADELAGLIRNSTSLRDFEL